MSEQDTNELEYLRFFLAEFDFSVEHRDAVDLINEKFERETDGVVPARWK